MTQTRTDVRPARLADVDAIASMVAAAFAQDPAWTFMLPSGTTESRAAFARALLVRRIRNGTAWVTDDCTAVAMWDRLGGDDADDDAADTDPDELWAALRTTQGEEAWARITAYEDALQALAPQRPYWYLGVLATHPDHQGRGLATAVIRPGLDAADADGWDCWLETSTPGNKAFYAGRGFTEAVPVDIPDGPPTWWLRRAAGRGIEAEIRAAERRLEQALSAPDPTAWVYEYTEDAVFDGGGHAVQGRAALLEMAHQMQPLSSVSIRPLRTEATATLATVWFEGSWISGPPESGALTEIRGMILWRREADGRWRVACEHIG